MIGILVFMMNQENNTDPLIDVGKTSGDVTSSQGETDDELQAILNGHQSGYTGGEDDEEGEEEESRNYTYQEGEFQLTGEQQFVLEDSQEYMDSVVVGKTTLDELVKLYGNKYLNMTKEPYSTTVEYALYDNASFIRYVIRNSDNIVIEKWLMIYSSMDSNVQLSAEMGSELVNLEEKIKEVSEGMTFDEVVKILGDKYFLMGEALENKVYKWKDTWENAVQLVFNNKGILVECSSVSMFY